MWKIIFGSYFPKFVGRYFPEFVCHFPTFNIYLQETYFFRMAVHWSQVMFISPIYLCHTCMKEPTRYNTTMKLQFSFAAYNLRCCTMKRSRPNSSGLEECCKKLVIYFSLKYAVINFNNSI